VTRLKLVGCLAAVAVLSACVSGTSTGPAASSGCCAGLPQSGTLVVGTPAAPPTQALIPGDASAYSPPPLPVLTAVDLAAAGGRDEIVFTVQGDGAVGWSLRVVSEVVPYGGATIAPVAGESIVQVDLSGVTSLGEQPRQHVDPDLGSVVEVVELPALDSIVQSFIGLRADAGAVEVDERAVDGGMQLVVSIGDR
jgi:hypothetical protein